MKNIEDKIIKKLLNEKKILIEQEEENIAQNIANNLTLKEVKEKYIKEEINKIVNERALQIKISRK